MALVHMGDLLRHAYDNGYAVGAFDVVGLEFVTGIIAAAEDKQAPVIINVAEPGVARFDFELLMAAVERAAERTPVPVAIALSPCASLASAIRGINLGCTGVMVDPSRRPLTEVIAHTREIADTAHACGLPVEGRLGDTPGAQRGDAAQHPARPPLDTTAAEARSFVDATGVDFLSISVATLRDRTSGGTALGFDRLAELNRALGIPLAVHDATGLSDAEVRHLIGNGVARIDDHGALGEAAGRHIRANAVAAANDGYMDLVSGTAEAVRTAAIRRINLWGGAGRAEAVRAQCRPSRTVEHVIFYNMDGLDAPGVADLMRDGRRILSAIPGVRRVFTGHAVHDDVNYRHCWLVRFAGTDVIDNYRDHPAHRRFADERYRPFAGRRISVDFEDSEPST